MTARRSTHAILSATAVVVLAVASQSSSSSSVTVVEGFSSPAVFVAKSTSFSTTTTTTTTTTPLFAVTGEETSEDASAVFVPPPGADDDDDDDDVAQGADIGLATVEMLGKGAAKAKRGKRKGGPVASTAGPSKASVTLAPEEVFYEGPPAITETIVPTISILTVVGIIPAIASWSRQAWVRYKITTRRIRVTSGIGGKDMAEIVYPDIVELRTAKRLFGDGDMVAFLRDGAKFEMRNIPNFDETMDFVLDQVGKDVAAKYREKGDVTNPQ